EETPLLGFDQGIDPPAVRRRHGDPHLAPDAGRQPLAGQLLPAVAAVARDVEATSRPAARHLPGAAAGLPEAGEDDVGVARVRGAGPFVLLQHLLPGLTAVFGAVDAALRVGAEGVAEDGGEGDVGIAGVDDHGADLPLLCPDVGPGLAAVDRLVDAVAGPHVAA